MLHCGRHVQVCVSLQCEAERVMSGMCFFTCIDGEMGLAACKCGSFVSLIS